MLLLLVFLLWVCLGILLALRFHDEQPMSRFELTRLSGLGDQVARELLARRQDEPVLESLRQIVVTLLSTALVTTAVFSVGLIGGVALGAVLLILAPLLVRLSVVKRLSNICRDKTRPFAVKAAAMTRPVLWLLRSKDAAETKTRVYSRDELLDVVHTSKVLHKDEERRLKAALYFDGKLVADVMTPKSMIVTADVHDTLGPLVMDELHASRHSRFPVIDGDIDHIVGMLYLKELIDLKSGHRTVKAAMRPKVFYIRDDQNLAHALHGFLRSHQHLFVVVNEYRETVGLLTLEDVIEVLIGSKIIDEFDEFDDLRAVAQQNPAGNNQPADHDDI